MRKQNLQSQHIPYVEAELWNYKSQNILCAEAELQVTEYVWNISGSLCNGSKDMGAQGRRPLGQSHLGGAIIYWRWHILGLFLFSPLFQAVTSKFSEFMSPAL